MGSQSLVRRLLTLLDAQEPLMFSQEVWFKACSRIFAAIPPKLLQDFARVIGSFCFYVLKIRYRLVMRNLQAVFPHLSVEEREAIGADSYASFLLTIFETLAAGARPLGKNVEVQGRAYLDEALAEGRGCLILCMHLGNWEVLAGAVSQQVAATHVVVKAIGSGRINQFVVWLRRQLGYDAIAVSQDSSPARQIFKALGRKEIVGFVMDQYQPGAPELPYFGYTTKTNPGLATIWRRSGAPVVPVFIERLAPHRHRAIVLPPLELERSNDPSFDVIEATRIFNKTMEQMVLANPSQYFWLHDRWKWKKKPPSAKPRWGSQGCPAKS